jgi:hypothetical protein
MARVSLLFRWLRNQFFADAVENLRFVSITSGKRFSPKS